MDQRSFLVIDDIYQYLFGRYRRTRRECGGSWSYTKVGVYEHYVSSRYQLQYVYLGMPTYDEVIVWNKLRIQQ